MKIKTTLSALTVAALISGCSTSIPECGDQKSVDLVTEKVMTELKKQGGGKADEVDIKISSIRTQNTNEQTGAQQCAAELNLTMDNGRTANGPITYTIEKTDEDELFVSVEGL